MPDIMSIIMPVQIDPTGSPGDIVQNTDHQSPEACPNFKSVLELAANMLPVLEGQPLDSPMRTQNPENELDHEELFRHLLTNIRTEAMQAEHAIPEQVKSEQSDTDHTHRVSARVISDSRSEISLTDVNRVLSDNIQSSDTAGSPVDSQISIAQGSWNRSGIVNPIVVLNSEYPSEQQISENLTRNQSTVARSEDTTVSNQVELKNVIQDNPAKQNTINSPIVSHDNESTFSGAGLIEGNARNGPEKIPIEKSIPFARSNSPPVVVMQNETAGPRGVDQRQETPVSNQESIFPNEEAETIETRREVLHNQLHRIDWLNSYFRRPVSVISREGPARELYKPVNSVNSLPIQDKMVADVPKPVVDSFQSDIHISKPVPDIYSDKTSVSKPANINPPVNQQAPEVKRIVSPGITTSDSQVQSPKTEFGSHQMYIPSQNTEHHSNSSPGVEKHVLTQSDVPAEPIPQSSIANTVTFKSTLNPVYGSTAKPENSYGTKMMPEPSTPVTTTPNAELSRETSQRSITEPELMNNLSRMNIKVVNQEILMQQSPGRDNPVQQTMDPVSVDPANSASLHVTSASPSPDVIQVDKPISVLGNAPDRIASEIVKADSESLLTGGKAVLEVALKPPRLGPLNIELVKTESGIDVKLVVRTIFAKELLLHRGDEIKSVLQDQGIDIRRFEVLDMHHNRQETHHQFQNSNSGEAPFGREQGSSRSPDSTDFSNVSDEEIEHEVEQTRMIETQINLYNGSKLNVLA